MLSIDIGAHLQSCWDHMAVLITGAVTGGTGWRIGAAIARSLPTPMPVGSRLYLFAYNLAQNLFANPDLKADPK